MEQHKKKEIEQPLETAKLLLLIGVPLCLLTPILFTQTWNIVDFSNTGSIGDTIGGITAPFINILGAILVFLALKSQIRANISLQEQVERQSTEKKLEIESKQLNQLYDSLKSSIDNFRFSTLDRWELGEDSDRKELVGSEAIYKLFQDFYCDFHATEEEMKCNPKITEIISMLEICDSLLSQIEKSDVPEKETIWTLVSHQFLYRIFPKIRSEYPDNLKTHYCKECKHNHGLPERLCELFKSICKKIQSKDSSILFNENRVKTTYPIHHTTGVAKKVTTQ